MSVTWPAINGACRCVAETAADCRRLEIPGVDWGDELRRAIETATVAERKRRGISGIDP